MPRRRWIGAPLTGFVATHLDARSTRGLAGNMIILAARGAILALRRLTATRADERPDEETTAPPELLSLSTRTLAVTARQWDH